MRALYLNVSEKPYSENQLNKEEKEFISKLLVETHDQFREVFLEMANSKSKKDRRKFMSIRASLAELVVPKPVMSYEIGEQEFNKLLGLLKDQEGGKI